MMLRISISILAAVVLYLLLSGAAFVSIYRLPRVAPRRFYGWFFQPLDWLSRRVPVFSRAYKAFHDWCYARFVA